MNLDQLKNFASKRKKENKKYLDKLKTIKPGNVDRMFEETHYEVFEHIDCLFCANCCKTTSPIFNSQDIERLAKNFKLKPGAFTEKYLHIDEDNDYVLKQTPCPFLGTDNYCSVYENRPKACREYPHTNHKPMQQVFGITLKNTEICPAVYDILEQLKKNFPL